MSTSVKTSITMPMTWGAGTGTLYNRREKLRSLSLSAKGLHAEQETVTCDSAHFYQVHRRLVSTSKFAWNGSLQPHQPFADNIKRPWACKKTLFKPV